MCRKNSEFESPPVLGLSYSGLHMATMAKHNGVWLGSRRMEVSCIFAG